MPVYVYRHAYVRASMFRQRQNHHLEGQGTEFAKVNSSMRKGGLSSTLHVYRNPRVRVAADAQLPVVVVAPALDPAPRREDARVVPTQADGEGGDAWRRESARSSGIGKARKWL